MAGQTRFDSLGELLDALEAQAKDEDGVGISSLTQLAGQNAFGPAILLPGLIALSPLSGIPTIPSMIGAIVTLVAGQLLLGRSSIWLPKRLESARLDRGRFDRAMRFVRPVSRWIDTVSGPRFAFATREWAMRGAALICVIVAATMPPLEILPFLATLAGLVLTIFGLAITLRDGLLMLIGLGVFLSGVGAGLWLWQG